MAVDFAVALKLRLKIKWIFFMEWEIFSASPKPSADYLGQAITITPPYGHWIDKASDPRVTQVTGACIPAVGDAVGQCHGNGCGRGIGHEDAIHERSAMRPGVQFFVGVLSTGHR